MRKCLCEVYRCSSREGTYLYVDKKVGLSKIPEMLNARIGRPELAMTLLLTEDKILANANAMDVLSAIASQGFYLQMPIAELDDKEMVAMRELNSRL